MTSEVILLQQTNGSSSQKILRLCFVVYVDQYGNNDCILLYPHFEGWLQWYSGRTSVLTGELSLSYARLTAD